MHKIIAEKNSDILDKLKEKIKQWLDRARKMQRNVVQENVTKITQPSSILGPRPSLDTDEEPHGAPQQPTI